MSDRPLVSIGMPVRNGEPFLRQALESLLRQDHHHIELLISDNASTDGTRQICTELAATDDRVTYHRHPGDVGVMANFNAVLKAARGEYFMWAAADDLWEPEYVSTLLALLESDPRAVLAFCKIDNVDADGVTTRTYPDILRLASDDTFDRLTRFMIQDEESGKANLIYGLTRRAALHAAGGFKVWGTDDWGSDMLVVFRLLSLGNLCFSETLLFHKRLVAGPSLPDPGTPRAVGLPAIFRHVCSVAAHVRTLNGYFSGYGPIVDASDSLTHVQKRRFRSILWRRALRRYRREIDTELVGPAVRAARRRLSI